MNLSDLIAVDAIFTDLKAVCKKQLLQLLSEKAARLTGFPETVVFDTILKREKLGSTGIGNGIAIPHGKLPDLAKITGIFAKLSNPVDFDSLDDRPVDLVFMLLAPEGAGADHLKTLSRIARLLRNPDCIARLRQSKDAQSVYRVLTQASDLAAI